MRKIVFGFIALYVIIFAVFARIGHKGEFAAEKALWKINHLSTKLLQDIEHTPEHQVDKIIAQYQKFIEDFGETPLGPAGYFQISKIYWKIEDYKKSRATSLEMIKKYEARPEIAAEGYAQVAASYVQEKNLEEAIKHYKIIIDRYPITLAGLNTPIFIAQAYVISKEPQAAQDAYQNAISYYKGLIAKNPETPLEVQSLKLIASVYMGLKEWQKAVDALAEIVLKFGWNLNPTVANEVVKTINTITLAQTKNYDATIEIYTRFIAKYPDHPFNPVFKNLISGFNNLKNQPLVPTP